MQKSVHYPRPHSDVLVTARHWRPVLFCSLLLESVAQTSIKMHSWNSLEADSEAIRGRSFLEQQTPRERLPETEGSGLDRDRSWAAGKWYWGDCTQSSGAGLLLHDKLNRVEGVGFIISYCSSFALESVSFL